MKPFPQEGLNTNQHSVEIEKMVYLTCAYPTMLGECVNRFQHVKPMNIYIFDMQYVQKSLQGSVFHIIYRDVLREYNLIS